MGRDPSLDIASRGFERSLAKRYGRIVDAQEKAWASALPFAIECRAWDAYNRQTEVRIEVSFEGRKPEPQLLADALRAVSAEVLVEVVGLIGAEPADYDIPMPRKMFNNEPEALTDMRAQAVLAASGGGFAIVLRVRRNQNNEYWPEHWIKGAVASAFETVHLAYPIESLRVCD